MHDETPPGGVPHAICDDNSDMSDEHNEIFFTAVSATRMPMIVTDPRQDDNPIVFANPAFMNMTGYSEKELIGYNCRFLQGPETDRELVSKIRDAIESRHDIAVEILNYKKNGSSFWNALFIAPILDKAGNLIYFFASQLDVTRRRDIEDALHQSQKMEAVGQLTGGIAHDFNNLLTVVQGFAELLQANIESATFNPVRAQRSIAAILQATEKGAMLTSQLLAFARKQKLQGRVVSLPDLITRLIPLIEKSVGDTTIINVEHKSARCNTRLDSSQAEMAILNIAVNARDAMQGRGTLSIITDHHVIEEGDIKFDGIVAGDYVSLCMVDDGTGMDPETLARITEPFFTTKKEGKGTGLGMSMVYGFVKQSGGFMKVESEIGVGTAIMMLFKTENAEADGPNVKAQKAIIGRRGDKETILIVEDKVDLAEYAEEVLSTFGYTVLKATNADDALVILQQTNDVRLLFSDIMMPGSMNGAALARTVARMYPSIKILLATGYTDITVDTQDEYGASFDIMNKPYKRVELVNRIRSSLDGPDGIS